MTSNAKHRNLLGRELSYLSRTLSLRLVHVFFGTCVLFRFYMNSKLYFYSSSKTMVKFRNRNYAKLLNLSFFVYINTVFRKGMGSACEIQIFQPYKVSKLKFHNFLKNDCEMGMILASCPFSKSATECTIRFAKERAYRREVGRQLQWRKTSSMCEKILVCV
jgi:hypothetical protein